MNAWSVTAAGHPFGMRAKGFVLARDEGLGGFRDDDDGVAERAKRFVVAVRFGFGESPWRFPGYEVLLIAAV